MKRYNSNTYSQTQISSSSSQSKASAVRKQPDTEQKPQEEPLNESIWSFVRIGQGQEGQNNLKSKPQKKESKAKKPAESKDEKKSEKPKAKSNGKSDIPESKPSDIPERQESGKKRKPAKQQSADKKDLDLQKVLELQFDEPELNHLAAEFPDKMKQGFLEYASKLSPDNDQNKFEDHLEAVLFDDNPEPEVSTPVKSTFQSTLVSALAAKEKSSSEKKQQDLRSRTNSLRNGETSKIIQNVDLEVSGMDKDDLQEYLRFVQQKQQTVETAPRKLSSEFFKEESKRLGKKMEKMRKKFTCFHQSTTGDIATLFSGEMVARTNIQSLFTD
jgi:hypothetical protein